ncbi:hypothetical protein CAEBREN_02227 [Caenorhabditis brenneri]|uniref:Uncharacterized protein n=1 Tax=Caenorhabditis brenneri TaxID=135651 RepID=G0N507_CAEBE|nr:hypothetical protein CAEBREN_02227 [Caenorhabditis brenneri]
MVEQVNVGVDPIVISLEAYFHGIQSPSWGSKLIQFPRGGILWGLHLSKQEVEGSTTRRIIGCLICFGPVKENSSNNWSITFDHVFTLSHKRVGCAGTIQKGSAFSESQHIINNYEWGDDNSTSTPVNWENHESVKLSCHLYISETTGIDREVFKAAAELCRIQGDKFEEPSTPFQVESQVMKIFGDLLLNENITYTETGMEAAEKLAVLLSFPRVIDTCRNYLIRTQTGSVLKFGEVEEESKKHLEFDLTGFDYTANLPFRRERMDHLRESDIISMFQQLCAIAFKK